RATNTPSGSNIPTYPVSVRFLANTVANDAPTLVFSGTNNGKQLFSYAMRVATNATETQVGAARDLIKLSLETSELPANAKQTNVPPTAAPNILTNVPPKAPSTSNPVTDTNKKE